MVDKEREVIIAVLTSRSPEVGPCKCHLTLLLGLHGMQVVACNMSCINYTHVCLNWPTQADESTASHGPLIATAARVLQLARKLLVCGSPEAVSISMRRRGEKKEKGGHNKRVTWECLRVLKMGRGIE